MPSAISYASCVKSWWVGWMVLVGAVCSHHRCPNHCLEHALPLFWRIGYYKKRRRLKPSIAVLSKSELCWTPNCLFIFDHNHCHHNHSSICLWIPASSSRSQDVLDVELCTYALTLVNKTLYEIDDQPTFYDQTDYMEDLGIDRYILRLFLA